MGDIHYIESGRGPGSPVVFLHAFPLSSQMWVNQIEAFSVSRRVIAPDTRGFGKSELGTETPTMETYAKDVTRLLDQLQVAKATLVGLSMGGYIALRLKELYPNRVDALVLADTKTEPDAQAAKQKRLEGIQKLKGGGVKEFTEGFLKGALCEETLTKQSMLVEQIREMILSNSVPGMCAALNAMKDRTDTKKALTENPVRTLILVGEGDTLTPPAQAEAMQKLASGSFLKRIPSAGHLSNLENSAIFNRELSQFLNA